MQVVYKQEEGADKEESRNHLLPQAPKPAAIALVRSPHNLVIACLVIVFGPNVLQNLKNVNNNICKSLSLLV